MSSFARNFNPVFIDYKAINCIRCYHKHYEYVYRQAPIITWVEIDIKSLNNSDADKTYYVDVFTAGSVIYNKEPLTVSAIKDLMEKVKACHE
jgi:hypothetical protein